MGIKSHLLLLICLGLCTAWMDERPVLESQDGNLFISSAKDRNITFKVIGNGYVNVNEINLLHVANAAHNATRLIERWKTGYLVEVESSLQRLSAAVVGPFGVQRRVSFLESLVQDVARTATTRNQSAIVNPRIGLRRVNDRIRRLEDRVRVIQTTLRENECLSNPCQNGGTCQDLYGSYQCQCTSSWEGPNCLTDVNECARFLGTDLGCQNGATCFNSPGSYRCECPPGWFGLHCTQKTSICNSQNSDELCGHGVCVSRSSSPLGYTCICDQGWENDGTNPACTKDVDECAGRHPACSVNPRVACRNVPGSFFCESCPHGYTGNGYYCSDIDECLVDNGGCSTVPHVQCLNSMGSRVCGPCPAGYRGDGVTCIYVGGCAINNGGCHPLATCVENPALTSAYVQCRCPPGYQGSGMGPNGCQPPTDVYVSSACASSPCIHGSCVPGTMAHTFTCRCNPGYTGVLCNIPVDPCIPNPCKNNGSCLVLNGAATCDCPPTFTGNRCETPRQTCGGVSRNPVGRLEFPIGGNSYQNGLSCAWVLITNQSLVLNVTFTAFNLEHSPSFCKFDFLQIHDGRNAGAHQIGRFCGDRLPNGNGNIVSSHNSLYFWFHSDSSISHNGFALHWNSIEPVCGGVLNDDFGTITSPGSPGRYPPNRDCYWTIQVSSSKRIQFHFGLLMLEEHPTCDYDYVKITGYNEEEQLGLYCNHSRPAPLITPGSEAVVHFHSDPASQDAGFHIHYSTVGGVPGCSGVYTAFTGMIASPSHTTPSAYEPNMECEWKIQLPLGERIKVTWMKFDLERSTSCDFDYVEIYDGPNTKAPLIGRYCGGELPPQVKSSGNSLVVIFKSDASFEMEGFTLSYDVLCGGVIQEESGIIQSPMYPNPYHGSRTCYYEIIQPPKTGIILSIVDLDIEGHDGPPDCYFDYLEIFDGDTENATLLSTLCGGTEFIPEQPFLSTHNFMLLKFTTDSSIAGRGFKANFTTVERRCGGLLKAPIGTIESPTEDGSYGDNEDCIWTIQAPPGHVIRLSWLSFNLEYHSNCRNDYVSVFENYTTPERELIGTYCGTETPPILLTQTNTMTIIFVTDSSVTADGFTASYTFVDASRVCGGTFTKSTGIIRSPNYPGRYPAAKECVWVIKARNKYRVTLDVQHFQLEKHSMCAFDFLEIRNGGYDTSPLIGRFCGKDIPAEVISQANMLYVKFVSDVSRSGEGFEIQWSSLTEGCGGTMHAASGDIISPNYPLPYAHNADCTWKIAVAMGSLVQLIIVDVELENNPNCMYDYLEISEGIERRANKQRFCGTTHPKVIEAKTNTMTVRFRSDFTNTGRGFHIKYETLCRNTLRGFHGVIESPNFPDKYEHNANCSWTITAPKGNVITMSFSHLDIEGNHFTNEQCMFDYVEIKEGMDNEPNTELGKYCETDTELPKIKTGQNQLFMTFVTDSYIAFNGFRAEWSIEGCGGELTKPSDTFSSPGYPSGYPVNVECNWLIEVDYTHSIELTLHEVSTEKQIHCYFDKLQVFGGEDEEAPLIEVCFADKPIVYTSPGNKLFIKFYTDQSYSGRGFNASYKSVPLKCGGRFTADSGVIHSANYPENYPHQQDCEWLIQIDKNHVVNITFEDFDIENTSNCTDDYVKIFDGPTRDSPLLATHCHNELPPSYVSTSNEMLVVMRSDSIISAKGFKAWYQRACGARIVVKDQGVITPPNIYTSAKKLETANCTWILVAEDPGDHVTLTFSHLDMDPLNLEESYPSCFWNYLQVLEGESVDGPELGKWCNNVAPAPVTSTGSALTVHLYSRYDFNGHFAIIYSVLNSACGGNYTSEQGTIASPGYPESYPLNSECIWILNNSPGNRISLDFLMFDVEQSEHCDLDYLEIREESGAGKLISASCGTSIEAVRSSKSLWIKFKSDSSGTGQGFRAQYQYLGGNELVGPVGRITSPLYPRSYNKPGVFTWRITVKMGWVIRIEVSDVYIEAMQSECNNALKIYDGFNDEASTLAEVCHFTKPEPMTTSSNVAFIKLDISFIRIGNHFDLTWIQIPRETTFDNSEIKLSGCNEEVALTGEFNGTYDFHSPGWPSGYATNLHCNWLFTSPAGTHLTLHILVMDIEETSDCVADSVSVYAGNALTSTGDATLKQRLCYQNSSLSIIETENLMTVKFDTDSYLNNTGFRAMVARECGGKLGGPNGIIEVNNRTAVYGIRSWRLECVWVIEVKPGRTIEVKFESIDIALQDGNPACGNNYLMLKNGGESTSPLLGTGKYCGNIAPMPLETIGNKLFVKATGRIPNVRFKLSYREKNANCGGDFVFSSKVTHWDIKSPNYPNIPPPYAHCTWRAMAPAGDRLTIDFMERFDLTFSTTCDLEYVEVRDGGTENAKLLGRYCGTTAPSSISTTSNMISITFYTNVAEPKNGFHATILSGNVCGGIFRASSGTINSPNFPFFYPKNMNCTWLVIAPADRTLKISFSHMHLPGFRICGITDHVSIEEKLSDENSDALTNIGTFCGTTKPEPIETTSNKALITFYSDNKEFMTYTGFSLRFESNQEICGGELTALTGTIKSVGYPVPMTKSRYCDWKIKIPEGHQVVVDILDLDLGSSTAISRMGYSLSFYNDFKFTSRIKVLGPRGSSDEATSMEQIRSSSNTMMIGYYSSPGHRGFKLRYHAEWPAPCGGVITNTNGTLKPPTTRPFNESSYYCQWTLYAPTELTNNINETGVTMTIKVTGFVGPVKYCYFPQYVKVEDVGIICGNLTEPKYLRSPKPRNELIIVNGTYGSRMDFNLEYEWQLCGGVLSGPRHTIRSPRNISYPINCAWSAEYPDTGKSIKLDFTRLNLGSCDTAYISVRNGGPRWPEIGKFCGNIIPYNITSTSNQLWVEYHATGGPNDFEFNLQPASSSCGGALKDNSREISSPEFPRQYPNNAECTWEITADNGYHIGLEFVDRFSLETSANCDKDYILMHDWVMDGKTGGHWKDLGKVCGRNTPTPFNSTSNRMKVTFRSNEAVQSDGFRALWTENCGGVFEVNDEEKIIQSPGYPNYYRPNLFCNYTLVAPGQMIRVEFTDFHLEQRRGQCRFDNITIKRHQYSSVYTDDDTYCGDDLPPLQSSLSHMELVFRSDRYIQRHGFQFKYFISQCGGLLTSPGDIKPTSRNNEYFGKMNCTWTIQAPQDKNVVLRFESFITEYSDRCYYDKLAVYNGEKIVPNKMLGLVCGNLTDNLPVFKSDSNTMLVNFVSDISNHYEGFSAKVLFTSGAAAGCGGKVNLTAITRQNFRTQKAARYDGLEDCHWNVTAPEGKNIRFTIHSMDVGNKTNNTNKCSNDFLEVRDGGGPYAEPLGKFCGSEIPPAILSSTNSLWIRFSSDATGQGAGVTGTLETVDSLCGKLVRIVNDTKTILTSPHYPNNYAPGTRCRWILRHPDFFSDRLRIEFLDFAMADSEKCENEFLQITDKRNRKYINEGFGEDFVFSGSSNHPLNTITGSRSPVASYKYCGSALPHDFYSYDNELELSFRGESGGHRGFKLEYSTPTCNRNYTSEQGRIVHQGFTDCWITITAPVNHTISLYFNDFRLYDREHCTQSGLQVREGNFSGFLLANLCGVETPSPIFSTGNKLSLHSWSDTKAAYESYDIIYVTTDKGPGCGGRIFNYGGRFTSPFYPNVYRNDTTCTWDVSVPRGFIVVLTFTTFDIGTKSNCGSNNVKIYDQLPDGERSLRTTFCGGDDPAMFEATGNRIFVTYTSSVNNIGSGWVAEFMGKPSARSMGDIGTKVVWL